MAAESGIESGGSNGNQLGVGSMAEAA